MSFVTTELFPFLADRQLVSRISARLRVQEAKKPGDTSLHPSWQQYRALPTTDLLDSLRAEFARRDQLFRRAQAYLTSIAVLSAFSIGSLNLVRVITNVPAAVVGVAIAFPLLYFAVSAWHALRITAPERRYDLFLQERVTEGAVITGERWKDVILNTIQLNQATSLIANAHTECSYRCLRNGLVCLVVVLTLFILNISMVG